MVGQPGKRGAARLQQNRAGIGSDRLHRACPSRDGSAVGKQIINAPEIEKLE